LHWQGWVGVLKLSLGAEQVKRRAKGNAMANIQKYMVLYLVPTSVMENWSKTDPATRAPAKQKMRADWGSG
jgi:hypothetical protein